MHTPPDLPDLDRLCAWCDGTGVTATPEWAAWWERERIARAAWQMTHPGGDFDSSREARLLVEDIPDGSEATGCPHCGGTGRQPTEAGEKLLAFLRDHWRQQ